MSVPELILLCSEQDSNQNKRMMTPLEYKLDLLALLRQFDSVCFLYPGLQAWETEVTAEYNRLSFLCEQDTITPATKSRLLHAFDRYLVGLVKMYQHDDE